MLEELQAHDEDPEGDLHQEKGENSNAAVVQDMRHALLVVALQLDDFKVKQQLSQHQQHVKDHKHDNQHLHKQKEEDVQITSYTSSSSSAVFPSYISGGSSFWARFGRVTVFLIHPLR